MLSLVLHTMVDPSSNNRVVWAPKLNIFYLLIHFNYYLAFDEMSLLTPAIDHGDECAGWEICPKMILSLMHNVFKTLLFGSDLGKVVD